jgi:zinc protease
MKSIHHFSRCAGRVVAIVGAVVSLLPGPLSAQVGSPAHPSASASAQAGKARQETSVEGITEYQLPNGLQVLLFPDPSKPTVTVNVTYLVGSRHEGYGETGMAHLLEHLMFKGTPRHPNIPQELTERGSRPNGSTSYDRTNYYETVPASAANLAWALGLEADRMINSFIAQKDLASEFSVVRNELESAENDPANVLFQHVMAAAYEWHGYGRSTAGSRSDIEGVPIDRLKAFYQRYYQPDDAVLVVAGKFDPADALPMIEQRFGGIARPTRTMSRGNLLTPTYTVEPPQDGERSVIAQRVGDAPVVVMAYHVPAGSHPDFAAVDVLTRVLGDNPSGRLFKALVEAKLAARTNAFVSQLREPGLLGSMAQLRTGQSTDSARAAMAAVMDQVATTPVTAEEVARAKAGLLKEIELGFNNSEQVGNNLSEWAAMGDWRLMFVHRDRLEKVTAADVQRVAAAYLKPSNRTVGVFVPTAKPDRVDIPATPSVAAMVADYHGRAIVQTGEAFDATPQNIDARTKRLALPIGLQLQLLPKQTRGDRVIVQIQLRYGTGASLTGKTAIASLTADMLSRGTARLTREQVKDSLNALKARVSIIASLDAIIVRAETTRPGLQATLALIAQQLRTPRFDASDFETVKQEGLALIEKSRTEPQVLAMAALQRRLQPSAKGHPLYQPTANEKAAMYTAATIDDVKAFHRDFYGASFADAAVIGSFDADSVRSTLARLFGDWRSQHPFERLTYAFTAVDSTTVTILTPDKPMAVFMAGQNLQITDNDPAYPALIVANELLGGGFLNSRLATRIRQKEGLSYGVGSGLSVQALDRYGELLGFAIYAPQNVDRLAAAFTEEMQRMIGTGFTAQEVEAAKTGYLQQRLQSRSNDDELIVAMIAHRFAGRTIAFDQDLETKIRALTADDVNAAVRKYFDVAKIVQVRAGDFSKGGLAIPKP